MKCRNARNATINKLAGKLFDFVEKEKGFLFLIFGKKAAQIAFTRFRPPATGLLFFLVVKKAQQRKNHRDDSVTGVWFSAMRKKIKNGGKCERRKKNAEVKRSFFQGNSLLSVVLSGGGQRGLPKPADQGVIRLRHSRGAGGAYVR
ncbi:hypothetical protein [Acidaminobacterium chupaoyuni]